MPSIASITARYSRKFQLEKDDWIGLEIMVTIAVDEAEAHLLDPLDVRREAFRQARESVLEQIALARAERAAERAARAANGKPPAAAPGESLSSEAPRANHGSAPPATVEEAEQRFFARYGETIGGQDWSAVQRFLRRRAPRPTTIDGWIAAAETVRDLQRHQATVS